ncbi:hypothetical protein V1460_27570 [Streptomyces sp. SCSIO 30461]|uniref:hypothetical protein n=1 Tax=Streptomyces sp. SCSIO 30461 TaxID=3118085 RepID=UPI0030D471BF
MAPHDLGRAAAYAYRAVVRDGGKVTAVGPPERVLSARIVGEVYRQPLDVLRRPSTGGPAIAPKKGHLTCA